MRRDHWDYEDYSQRQSENGGHGFGKLFLILLFLQDTKLEHVPSLLRFLWIAILGNPFMVFGVLMMWIATAI